MIGIDVVSISRMQRFIDKFGNKGLGKFLLQSEIEIAKTTKTIAGFWASKEAISKALGCGIGSRLNFHDIRIYKSKVNAPLVELSKKAQKEHNVNSVHISITHDGGIAIAVCMIAQLDKSID